MSYSIIIPKLKCTYVITSISLMLKKTLSPNIVIKSSTAEFHDNKHNTIVCKIIRLEKLLVQNALHPLPLSSPKVVDRKNEGPIFIPPVLFC